MIDNKAAFFDVIKVIENASKAELQAISRVEKAIENNGVTSVVEAVDKPTRSKRIDPRGRRPRARIAADSSDTESTLTVSSDHAETGTGSPVYQDATSTPDEPTDKNITPEHEVVVVVPESKPVEVSKGDTDRVQTLPGSPVQREREGAVKSDSSAITDALDEQAKAQAKQLSESSKMNKLLEGIYRDQKGEIRQKNGAFATRKQKELFEKQERTEPSDENTEQSSLLRALSDWAIKDEVSGNRAIDAGGTAIGGSFWLAAKEVKDLTTEAGSLLSNNNLTSIDGIKSGLTKAKASALNPIETGKRLLLGKDESDSNEHDQAISPATQTEQVSSRDGVSSDNQPRATQERNSPSEIVSKSESVASSTKATETTSTVSHTEQESSRDSGHGISTESSPSATQERNSPAEIVSKSESVASSTKATETQTTSTVTNTEQVSSRDNVHSVSSENVLNTTEERTRAAQTVSQSEQVLSTETTSTVTNTEQVSSRNSAHGISTESSPSATPGRNSPAEIVSKSESVASSTKATETTSAVTHTEQVSSRDNVHSVSSENVPRATEERTSATQPVSQGESVPSNAKTTQTTSTTKTEQIESRKSGLSAADIRTRNNEPDHLVLVDAVAKQSAQYREYSDDHGKKLDDIKSAILASRDDRSGLLDRVDSDRKKKKKRRKGRNRHRGDDRRLKPKRTPKAVPSVMQTSGKAIGSSVAADTATKGVGVAAKGAGVAARGALRTLPLIGTALMTAFDAYEGFTNTQTQRQVFNVKEGEEVTTGQKSAMAFANVLDLGGLVSGGAGLLGSGLESLGVTGAAQALSFDTGSMAKSIYSFFGGNDEPQNDGAVKSEAKAQSAAKSDSIVSQGKDKDVESIVHEATAFASNATFSSTLQKESGFSVSRSEGVTSNGDNMGRDSERGHQAEASDKPGFSSHPFLYPMPKQGHGSTSLPSVSAGEKTTVSMEAEKYTPLVPSKTGAREEPTVIVNNDKELNSTVKQLLEETKKANNASSVKSSEASRNTVRNAHHNTVSINAGSRGASIPTTPHSITMQNVASDSE